MHIISYLQFAVKDTRFMPFIKCMQLFRAAIFCGILWSASFFVAGT